ncbi:MAG: EpsG family protein [Oscillospiraceae bacterium]|nr:EpsG family protein [Oscillospiraceae bacterium]
MGTNNMVPYIVLVLFIALIQIRKKTNLDEVDRTYFFALLVLFLFAALRGNGDGDYFAYLRFSTYVTSFRHVISPSVPVEIGFRFISYIVNTAGIHPQYVIMIMNAISLICVSVFIRKYSSDRVLSLLLFLPVYFQYDMHAARTAVAIGISLLGFGYIIDKKLVRFVITILIAATFHRTVLILLPLYFTRTIKIRAVPGILLLLIAIIATEIISVNTFAVTVLRSIGLVSMANRFEAYIGNVNFGYAFSILDPRLFISTGIFILSSYRLKNRNVTENVLINSALISSLIMVIFRDTTVFVVRLSGYYTIYTIILIPIILKRLYYIEHDCLNDIFSESLRKKCASFLVNYNLAKTTVVLFFCAYLGVYLYRFAVEYRLYFYN